MLKVRDNPHQIKSIKSYLMYNCLERLRKSRKKYEKSNSLNGCSLECNTRSDELTGKGLPIIGGNMWETLKRFLMEWRDIKVHWSHSLTFNRCSTYQRPSRWRRRRLVATMPPRVCTVPPGLPNHHVSTLEATVHRKLKPSNELNVLLVKRNFRDMKWNLTLVLLASRT